MDHKFDKDSQVLQDLYPSPEHFHIKHLYDKYQNQKSLLMHQAAVFTVSSTFRISLEVV